MSTNRNGYLDELRAAYRTAISAAQTCYGLMCTQFRRLLENRCTLQRIKPFLVPSVGGATGITNLR